MERDDRPLGTKVYRVDITIFVSEKHINYRVEPLKPDEKERIGKTSEFSEFRRPNTNVARGLEKFCRISAFDQIQYPTVNSLVTKREALFRS